VDEQREESDEKRRGRDRDLIDGNEFRDLGFE
jgi:hypothetical protein